MIVAVLGGGFVVERCAAPTLSALTWHNDTAEMPKPEHDNSAHSPALTHRTVVCNSMPVTHPGSLVLHRMNFAAMPVMLTLRLTLNLTPFAFAVNCCECSLHSRRRIARFGNLLGGRGRLCRMSLSLRSGSFHSASFESCKIGANMASRPGRE